MCAVFIRRYVRRQLFFQRNVYEKDTNLPFQELVRNGIIKGEGLELRGVG